MRSEKHFQYLLIALLSIWINFKVVESNPVSSFPDTRTCVRNYSHINNANVASYEGCTIIEGSIIIVKISFDTAYENAITNMSVLNALENVHEISGYLLVQGDHANFTSLSFLRNLRVIYGRELKRTVSVAIMGTSLEELGLRSLRKISRGDVIILGNRRLKNVGLVSLEKVAQGSVLIKTNPQLCYADTINWTQIVVGSGKRISLMDNANRTQYCEPNGFVCSDQCSADDGCWGQTADECRFCAHYLFGQTCVSSCNFQKGLYPETVNGTNECRHRDEQCIDDCTGEKEVRSCRRVPVENESDTSKDCLETEMVFTGTVKIQLWRNVMKIRQLDREGTVLSTITLQR